MISQVSTRTLAVTPLARRAAGTIAISCELLTKVVSNGVSTPPCDQSTVLCQWPLENVKLFDPRMVRVRSGLPTGALAGEIEMFAEVVPEERWLRDCLKAPPLQADCIATRNPTAIHEKRLSMTSSNPVRHRPARIALRLAWEDLICSLMRETRAKTAMPINGRFWKGGLTRGTLARSSADVWGTWTKSRRVQATK